jgi:type II secretory pathway pseudopilin PulG
MNPGERGFTLVDVLLGLGLVAVVLISIAGLFSLGARHVKGGRTDSEALAAARTILEEMEGWGFRQSYAMYGFDGSATAYTVDTRTNAYASKWQPALGQTLPSGYATILLESLGPGAPPPMNTTLAIRIMVTVHWDQQSRHRTIRLATVRM